MAEEFKPGDENDWTPWIGWRRAIVRLAWRLAAAGAVLLLAAWLLTLAGIKGDARFRHRHGAMAPGILVGLGVAWWVCRRVTDESGLRGVVLIPAFAALLAGMLICFRLAAMALFPSLGNVPFELAVGVGVMGLFAGVGYLADES